MMMNIQYSIKLIFCYSLLYFFTTFYKIHNFFLKLSTKYQDMIFNALLLNLAFEVMIVFFI